MHIKVKKLKHYDEQYDLPTYASKGAAGADLRACLPDGGQLSVLPGQRILVPTGLAMEIPRNFELQVRPRSGLSLKTSLLVVNSPGTIDSDYRGEIKVLMGNFGTEPEIIRHGERIAQIVLAPVVQALYLEAESLDNSARGEAGFGSTGYL